jgi:hypothetical protein
MYRGSQKFFASTLQARLRQEERDVTPNNNQAETNPQQHPILKFIPVGFDSNINLFYSIDITT